MATITLNKDWELVKNKSEGLRILVCDKDDENRPALCKALRKHDVKFNHPEDGESLTDSDLLEFDLLILDPKHSAAKKLLNKACTYYPDNLGRLVTFLLLYGFWITLSGQYDPFHLSLGFVCSFLVGGVSHDLLFEDIRANNRLVTIIRFIRYLPWLFYQIILANLHVAYLVLNPRLPIDPRIIKLKTGLMSDISRVTLANSITLTPGTVTLDVNDEEFYVHAISKKVADDLLTGEMEQRAAYIYLEGEKFKKFSDLSGRSTQ
jgi:multicomponent Na+:H+ antiporter subunit E